MYMAGAVVIEQHASAVMDMQESFGDGARYMAFLMLSESMAVRG